ncbi:MAG: FecR domain-containing protein [Burkholderiales bacterium]|jgi:hypothetical protein|nr:FecR domain-containing protein [Burkholderiales bacterium]
MKSFPVLALVALLALSVSGGARAAADIHVHALTMPAWVVKDGARRPLAAGAAVEPGATVETGDGARVQLALADGSTVRLGENARFTVATAAMNRDSGLFKATLRVLVGAFRFTTSALAKQRTQRDVSIQLPTVTAGIRGTDLWGKATDARDFVVLIEGAIGVQRSGDAAEIAMTQPLSLIDAPKGAPLPPGLDRITQAELDRYATETDLAPDSGAVRNGGKWRVVIARLAGQSEALAVYDQLRDAGWAAAIRPVGSGATATYRVQITGFVTRADAEVQAARLKTRFGFDTIGVTR